jgi:hypothetical protein
VDLDITGNNPYFGTLDYHRIQQLGELEEQGTERLESD